MLAIAACNDEPADSSVKMWTSKPHFDTVLGQTIFDVHILTLELLEVVFVSPRVSKLFNRPMDTRRLKHETTRAYLLA